MTSTITAEVERLVAHAVNQGKMHGRACIVDTDVSDKGQAIEPLALNTREDTGVEAGPERFVAYAHRIGKLFAAKAVAKAKLTARTAAESSRYVAYSSDIGESGRPVLPNSAVNALYGGTGL